MAYDRVEGGDISVPSLTILDVEVSDKTYYRMRATNRDGTTISALIYLDVNTSTYRKTFLWGRSFTCHREQG